MNHSSEADSQDHPDLSHQDQLRDFIGTGLQILVLTRIRSYDRARYAVKTMLSLPAGTLNLKPVMPDASASTRATGMCRK